jgi:decaprenylphospho-beta-D-ribofuranose 2-oxidase
MSLPPATRPVPTKSVLTGWGRTAPSVARLRRNFAPADVQQVVAAAGARGVIARGLGRSYGDAAQNGGGDVIGVAADHQPAVVDRETETVEVSGGTSLNTLLRDLVPQGWFIPVSPGTRYVTIGGAIAADVHGKNHHVDGSFGRHVRWLDLVDGCGDLRRLDPATTPREFWATVGGMGLTGVITRACVAVIPIESSWTRVASHRIGSLDEAMSIMAATDRNYRYSVAWIDLTAHGRTLGRTVLTHGDHARSGELTATQRADPLRPPVGGRLRTPGWIPRGLLNRAGVRAFNEVWYWKAPREQRDQLVPLGSFFHPLDAIRDWNRLYGRGGFVQYQFVVPFGAEPALTKLIERVAATGSASFLSVLKRFGAANPAPLSFPLAGWTLALDLPARRSAARLLDDLDSIVAAAGGRIYLAKDSRARAATIAAMYPQLDDFIAVRAELDPRGVFISDLARRLDLSGRIRHPGRPGAHGGLEP